MRIIVTNISPEPLPLGARLVGSPAWWTICTGCNSVPSDADPALRDHTIEAECKQHALDYATSHARLSHAGASVTVVIEEQLLFDFVPQRA